MLFSRFMPELFNRPLGAVSPSAKTGTTDFDRVPVQTLSQAWLLSLLSLLSGKNGSGSPERS